MSLSKRLFSIQRALQQDALRPSILEFGGYAPDRAALGNPGVLEAKNVIPTADGFRPFKTLTAVSSNALTARCQGATPASDGAGNAYIFAGDATKLYRLVNNAFEDVSGATYTIAAEDQWEYAQFGSELIATGYADNVQGFTLGTDSTFSTLMTSTLKPKARHIGIVRDFVVLGNTNDTTDGVVQNRVWWSGINDATDFDPAASTQCDYQDIPEGGWVRKIVGGADYGLVFMERQIYRMSYVGSPLVFRFDPIDRQRGTSIPGSVIGTGRMTFFISEEGFFLTDGLGSVPIGQDMVDKTFWDNFDNTYASRVTASIDPVNKTVMWAWPDGSATNGNPNNIYVYNWVSKKWSRIDQATEVIFPSIQPGYTLDGLDAISTDIDALAISLDSRAWTGGERKLGAFDTSHQYGTFTGTNMAAVVDTGDFQPYNNGFSTVTEARPLTDGGTITVQLASRVRLLDTVTFGSAVAIDTDGKSAFTVSSRYHRLRQNIAAGGTWNHTQGFQINASSDGSL